jgi:hypothetical protein
MYRRRLAAFAGAIGMLGALLSSGVAARADTTISDAQFTTMVDTYVAQAISGQGLCLSVPMTNDGTCPSSTQSSTDKNNIEVCVEHDTMVDETCVIDQTNVSGHNIAIVIQFFSKTQTANQTARITQNNQDGSNLAAIVQIVKESTQSGITQMDDQEATISQNGNSAVTDAGRNLTILHQSSTQFGQAGPLDTQEQDSTEHGNVSQSRGGVSRAHADQSQSQTLKGMGIQTQRLDPRCCMFQQSNPNNNGDIAQTASQFEDNPRAQDSTTLGDCNSSGQCAVDQTASINGNPPVRQHCGPTSCSIGIACSTFSGCQPCPIIEGTAVCGGDAPLALNNQGTGSRGGADGLALRWGAPARSSGAQTSRLTTPALLT